MTRQPRPAPRISPLAASQPTSGGTGTPDVSGVAEAILRAPEAASEWGQRAADEIRRAAENFPDAVEVEEVEAADLTLRDLLRTMLRTAWLRPVPGPVAWAHTYAAHSYVHGVEVVARRFHEDGSWTVWVRQRGTAGRMSIEIINPTVAAVAAAARLCGWDLAAVDREEGTR